MPPRGHKLFEGCRWCKRSWDESCKPRRSTGFICIDCDRHIYQIGATGESRKKKLEELNADPAKQEEWNADVKSTKMRGRTYGGSGRKFGRKANPAREGRNDDVKRTQGRKGRTTKVSDLERSGTAKAKRVENFQSGVKGITWHNRHQTWQVQLKINGKLLSGGYFKPKDYRPKEKAHARQDRQDRQEKKKKEEDVEEPRTEWYNTKDSELVQTRGQ